MNTKRYYELFSTIITAFAVGLVGLSLEMITLRLFAPMWGQSLGATSIVVSLTLLAMASGQMMAMYRPNSKNIPYRIEVILIFSGVYLFLSYYFHDKILEICDVDNIYISIAQAFLVLFFLPISFISSIPPFLVKLLLDRLDIVRATSTVLILSTLGSLLGGLLPSFILFPYLGVLESLRYLLIVILIVSILSRLQIKYYWTKTFALILLLILFLFPKINILKPDVLYKIDSSETTILIKKGKKSKMFIYNSPFGAQSILPNGNDFSNSIYDLILLVPLMKPTIKKVLILGNGPGLTMKMLAQSYSNLKIDGVELNKEIINIGDDLIFKNSRNKHSMNIYNEDGRVFLRKSDTKYDFIFSDIFNGIILPFHTSTYEYFCEIKTHLNEKGIFVFNFPFQFIDTELHSLFLNTLNKVFRYTYQMDHLIIASNDLIDSVKIRKKEIMKFGSSKKLHQNLIESIDKFFLINHNHDEEKRIFTDDWAPTEYLATHSFSWKKSKYK